MRKSCSSERPSLAVGRVEGTALRAAIAPRHRRSGPFTLGESLDAGGMLADELELERAFVMAGVAFDLMCGARGVPRKTLAQRLRVSMERLRCYELTWELLDQEVRFDLARRAVRIALAQRAGGGR